MNYDSSATEDDGSCLYAGCTNPDAINYCVFCTLDDGTCEFEIILGCTNDLACNYNPMSTEDDGSCVYDFEFEQVVINTGGSSIISCTEPPLYLYVNNDYASDVDYLWSDENGNVLGNNFYEYVSTEGIYNVLVTNGYGCTSYAVVFVSFVEDCGGTGCTDPAACNFDLSATVDDGTCGYPATYYNCDGDCINDSDVDGICDEIDDCVGSYDECGVCNGSGDPFGDGCCGIYYDMDVCTDPDACNYQDGCYNSDNSLCIYEDECNTCDGIVDTDGDGIGDCDEILGCTDSMSCNFDLNATEDDNSCIYPEQYYDCDGNCVNDVDNDSICNELDNCPDDFNPNQEDFDSDNIGDACDGIGLDQEIVNKQLIKIIDVLGRDINIDSKKSVLLYIYDDGSIEKKYILE